MAKKNEKKPLEKKKWVAQFNLVGKAKINDYTYKIDEKSEKSDWIYNTLNLGVDCGEKFGTVYAEMMGGYGSKRDNICYVHGKNDDEKDDWDNRFTVDWDDRTDTDILDTVGDMCFIKIGLEKDKQDKTVTTRFLSAYDSITYIKENLTNDTVINVKGNLKYQLYEGKTSVKKEITSIFLSKAEPDKYHASFTQSLLIKGDSIGDYNKDKGVLPLYGTVLEYTKKYNDKEVKCNIPMTKMFEIEVAEDKIKFWKDKLCKVKKNTVSEIIFEGDLIEGGALVETMVEDLPDDIKELIEIGAYTEEEALARCTESAGREKRMIIRKPSIKMVGDEGKKVPVIQKIEEKYSEEDLILDFMIKNNDETDDTDTDTDEETTEIDSDDDWLNALD